MKKEKIKTPSIENLPEFLKTHKVKSWKLYPSPDITAFELCVWDMFHHGGIAEHLEIYTREDWLSYCPSLSRHLELEWKKFESNSSSILKRICNFLKFGK